MNATPPEANIEYSRGVDGPKQDSLRDSRAESEADRGARASRSGPRGGSIGAAVFAAALLGALLLLVAEFTTLFEVRTAAAGTVREVATGSHHDYALVPIAVLAGVLGYAVWRAGSRPALLAIGVLGVLALLIAVLGDLPDTNASGLVQSAGHYVEADSTPSAGFYMETLGAVVLVIASVSGFILLGAPGGRRRRAAAQADAQSAGAERAGAQRDAPAGESG